MAVANFRMRIFENVIDAVKFIQTDPDMTELVSISTDSGRYIVFYKVA